jgi:hypothetical protein
MESGKRIEQQSRSRTSLKRGGFKISDLSCGLDAEEALCVSGYGRTLLLTG